MNDTTTLPPRTKERRPRTVLRMTVMLLLVALVAAGLFQFQRFKAGILKQVVISIRSQVPTVATTKASMQPWQPRQTAVGSARASNGADLAAELGGVVDQIVFESGQSVRAGTVLLRLRPNDDEAKLAQLQANAELANVTLQRDEKQLAAHGVAQATVDSDAANLKVARAQVAAQQAVMAEKVVRAPFDGKLGVR
jgi:membrane fusion protein, multidrug efflux system